MSGLQSDEEEPTESTKLMDTLVQHSQTRPVDIGDAAAVSF